ncbi:Exocyst complex component SEC6 [Galdieria sulphuraria]|nr:Exocyst complex component SEC6 [Galdieria sulphuraria]
MPSLLDSTSKAVGQSKKYLRKRMSSKPNKSEETWNALKDKDKIRMDAAKEVAAILSKAEIRTTVEKKKKGKHQHKSEQTILNVEWIEQAVDFHNKKLQSRKEEMLSIMSTIFPTGSSALEELNKSSLSMVSSLNEIGKEMEKSKELFGDLPKEIRVLLRVAAYVIAAQRDAEEMAQVETEASKVSSLLAFGDGQELDIFQIDSDLRRLALKREQIIQRSFGCSSMSLASSLNDKKSAIESLWQRSGGTADVKLLEILRSRVRNCLHLCKSDPACLVAALRILEKRSLVQFKLGIDFYMFGKYSGMGDIATTIVTWSVRDAVADLALTFDKDAANTRLDSSSPSTTTPMKTPVSASSSGGSTLSFTPKSAKTETGDLIEQVLNTADLLIGNLTFVVEEVESRFPPRHRVFHLFMTETYNQVGALLWWLVSKLKELSSYDTLAVISWIEEYHEHLPNLVPPNQVSNFTLEGPLERLSEGYATRAKELMKKWIANVVKVDKTSLLESTEQGTLYSNGPSDVFRIINEQLSIVAEHAKHGSQLLVSNVCDACAECLLEYRKLSVLSLMGIETEDGALERYCAMCNNHRRCGLLSLQFLQRANELLGTNFGQDSPGEVKSASQLNENHNGLDEKEYAIQEKDSKERTLDFEASNLWPYLFTEEWENGTEPIAESVIETIKDFFEDIEEFIEHKEDKQAAALAIAQTISETYLKEAAERFGSGKKLRRLLSGFRGDRHKQRLNDMDDEENTIGNNESKRRSAKRLFGKRCIERLRADLEAYSNYFKELGKPTEVSKRLVGMDTLADLLESSSPTAVSVVYTRLVRYLLQKWEESQSGADNYLEQSRGAASSVLPKAERLLHAYRPTSLQRLFTHKFEASRLKECSAELKRIWKEYGPSAIGKEGIMVLHDDEESESEEMI